MSTDPESGPLRLSLTLPGSASLGAYQAGAMGALGETFHELRRQGRQVHVDAIGGASAGAIVSVFFVHCLLEGLDVARVMHDAWVERVDVDLLRATEHDAPLGFDELRARIPRFLDVEGDPARRYDEPVLLHIGLTNLLGLTYPIETAGSAVEGITYVDWGQFELRPGCGIGQLIEPEGRSPMDYALASASHPGAFVPAAIDRSDARAGYEENGISNFPDSGTFWYTDGGLVESEPIGRVIAAARRRFGRTAGMRLHLVVDPRSSGPSGSKRWCRPDQPPSWLSGLRRALSILPSQALQDDLRRLAATNDRLARIDEVVDELGPALADQAPAVADLARRLGADIEPGDVDAALRALLRELCGVAGKERVDVEQITPLELARRRDDGVSELLAGDFIGAFGGFLSRDLRASDFSLGWASARSWLPAGLARHGLPEDQIEEVCDRLDSHPLACDQAFDGAEAGVGALSMSARFDLARLGGRVGRILVGASLPDVNPFSRAEEDRT